MTNSKSGWKVRDLISHWSEKLAPYVLLLPFLLYLIIFVGYALVRTVYFSFTDYDMFKTPVFVGMKNYVNLFQQSLFLQALKNSISFAVIVTALQTAGALLLALVMNQKIKGIRFFRAAFYLPCVTSSIVMTMLFMWLFQKQGVVNFITTVFYKNILIIAVFAVLGILFQLVLTSLKKDKNGKSDSFLDPKFITFSLILAAIITYLLAYFKIIQPQNIPDVQTQWLSTRETVPQFLGDWGVAKPLVAIMILNICTTIPTFSVLFLAGLQDISPSLYEAADVDGATNFQKFRYITIPQLKNVTFLVVTLGLIGTIQMFDQVSILSSSQSVGSQTPLESIITLAYYVYRSAFPPSGIPNIGLASATALILALLTLLIVFIQKKLTRE